MIKNGPILTQVFKNGDYSPQQQTSTLENAERIYNKLPNPENKIDSNVGIVVGRVQSGKTANIITLSALALDNGHKIIVLFLSDTNNLLTQNTDRFADVFNDIDNVCIVKKSKDGDFDTTLDEQALKYMHSQGGKLIICSLKHAKHINEVKELISKSPYKDDYAMIIDDEGDDIGLNTAVFNERFVQDASGNLFESERTSTNNAIVSLKKSFKKLGYISLTATPEANILLQDFQQLAPDYCVTMEPNDGYTGLLTFHGNDSKCVVEIDDFDNLLQPNGLPESFADAFVFFVAGCIARELRENGRKFKHSMMVHPCHKIENHGLVCGKISSYYEQIKSNLKKDTRSGQNFIDAVQVVFNQLMPTTVFEKEMVLNTIESMKIHLVNSASESNDLKKAMKILPYHLVIGGNMLDRGITIDGLAVTYMIRMARQGQVDTLLQRARWFGYKKSYIDLCRVYMPAELKQQFSDLIEVEESVWQFLYECDHEDKSPKDLAPFFHLPQGMKLASKEKADYVTTNFISSVKTQFYIVHDAEKNKENMSLVDNLDWKNAVDEKYNDHQHHKMITLSRNEFEGFINAFRFSDEDSMNQNTVKALLDKVDAKNIDLLYMRYDSGEKRSTSNYRVNALLQGRSEGLAPNDANYYVGDRTLRKDNLSVQIHRVILKNDIDNQYKAGDAVIMLAFVFPKGYIGGISSAQKISKDAIINRIS